VVSQAPFREYGSLWNNNIALEFRGTDHLLSFISSPHSIVICSDYSRHFFWAIIAQTDGELLIYSSITDLSFVHNETIVILLLGSSFFYSSIIHLLHFINIHITII